MNLVSFLFDLLFAVVNQWSLCVSWSTLWLWL